MLAENELILPDPVDANPIEVVLFVHVYVVPLTAPLKLTAAVDAPLQSVWLPGVVTVGVGLTVTVTTPKLLQPLEVPITVYTVVTDGVATTDVPVDAERLADGVQE